MKRLCSIFFFCFLFTACSESNPSGAKENSNRSNNTISSSSETLIDSPGICTSCDNFAAASPTITENGGHGSITTYGSVSAKETSLGGACNYGQTNIQYYAAIHVNVESGDGEGPWQGGAICGECVQVKAKTSSGFKTVIVRITDKCPDENCGVDLGGAPASDIMGIQVGRYEGEWKFVSCEGVSDVWGDSTALWIKEGASAFWSIIQVRNPKSAVTSIAIHGSAKKFELKRAAEAENFWTVPKEVLQSNKKWMITVEYHFGENDTWTVNSSNLTVGEFSIKKK